MHNLLNVIRFTVLDQIRYKSFYILLGVAVLLVLTVRSCQFNGQHFDSSSTVMGGFFRFVGGCVLVLSAMLSMRLFRRDKEDGSSVMFLARPIRRAEYAIGRIAGVWLVASGFMFVVHIAMVGLTMMSPGGAQPLFLVSSLMCSLNVLFMVSVVALLSMFLPDFIAAFLGIAIWAISGGIDIAYTNMGASGMVPKITNNIVADIAMVVWPKLSLTGAEAVALVTKDTVPFPGHIPPVVNVAVYCGIILFLIVAKFEKEEV